MTMLNISKDRKLKVIEILICFWEESKWCKQLIENLLVFYSIKLCFISLYLLLHFHSWLMWKQMGYCWQGLFTLPVFFVQCSYLSVLSFWSPWWYTELLIMTKEVSLTTSETSKWWRGDIDMEYKVAMHAVILFYTGQ